VAYQTQAVEAQVTHDVEQQAHTQLGDGYAMTGDPHVTVTQSRSQGSMLTLQIKGQATFAYQFQGRLQVLKQQIGGMSKQEATAFLTQQPGVSAVSLDISSPLGTNTATIPQDTNAIHITVLYSTTS
jgi:outer membrane biogenesis lipoprotein LolB